MLRRSARSGPARWLAVALVGAALAGCVTTPPSGVVLTVSRYSVSGTTEHALDRQLALHGPLVEGKGHALAVTAISFEPDVKAVQTAGGCRIDTARIDVKADMTLPNWLQRPQAAPKLARTWDTFEQYALEHELTHVAIARDYARHMEQAVAPLTAPTCAALTTKIAAVLKTLAARHERAQLAFDAEEKARFLRAEHAA